jgi:hypothetical protein
MKTMPITRPVDEWGVLPDSKSLCMMSPSKRLLLLFFCRLRVSLLGQLASQTHRMAHRIAFVAKQSGAPTGIPVVCPKLPNPVSYLATGVFSL